MPQMPRCFVVSVTPEVAQGKTLIYDALHDDSLVGVVCVCGPVCGCGYMIHLSSFQNTFNNTMYAFTAVLIYYIDIIKLNIHTVGGEKPKLTQSP